MALEFRVRFQINEKAPEKAQEMIQKFLDRLLSVGVRVARNEAPKDIGALSNNISIFRQRPLPDFLGGITTGPQTAAYASVMEKGRRPGSGMPFAPIHAWVLRHSQNFQPETKKERGMKRASFLRSITFRVRSAIRKRGIPSNPVFDNRFYMRKALRAIQKEAERLLPNLGNEIKLEFGKGGR